MDDIKQEQFWNFVKENAEKESFQRQLTLIYTYRRYKKYLISFFRDNEDYETKVKQNMCVLRRGFDGHYFFATKYRFLMLLFCSATRQTPCSREYIRNHL